MAKWSIDLKKEASEIMKEDFPKPPGYSDNFDTVRHHHAHPQLCSTLFFAIILRKHTMSQNTFKFHCI